ncbi:13269_t:CDS:2 [Entrophospora sp. SA101]|nr:13264_t:CDS:2 [Entrophospora sp. SA101]CAJ0648110.1 13269_t:CDS:2 [Entrophospora sp. SA101]CAJ0831309.1 2872_t:CDS:2 [Entrophospora sp. SA101]CAJ0911989.1 1514_t:CDS:2 [Entrophospora sp. SA101]
MAPNPIAMTNIKALTKGFETGKDLLKSNNSTSYADNDNNNKLNIIVMRDENNNNNNQIVSTPDHSTNVNKNKNIVTTNEENDDYSQTITATNFKNNSNNNINYNKNMSNIITTNNEENHDDNQSTTIDSNNNKNNNTDGCDRNNKDNIIDDQQTTSITSTDPVITSTDPVITSNGSTDATTTSADSVNKLTLPESVEDVLNSNRYIVNKHGWWPMFGGERTLKRKYDSFSSPSSPSSLSLFSPTFSKRQKLHNNPHHTSQFSARNYVTIKWYPLNNQLYVIAPIRTNTSSLPQNNFAAVTHRILAIKRLKSRQVKGFEPELHLPYDILVNDFEQYIENNTKSPWRDGTTEPRSGNIREIKSSRESTPEIDDENIDNSAGWLEESDDNNAGWHEDTENEDWDSTEYEILLSEAMNSIKNKNK